MSIRGTVLTGQRAPFVAGEVNLMQERLGSARLWHVPPAWPGSSCTRSGEVGPREAAVAARQLFKKPPQRALLLAAELPANL